MKKILYLTSYPSPYRVEFFDVLGRSVELTVLFSDRKEDQAHRAGQWFVESKGNFRAVQLEKSRGSLQGRRLCTDVVAWLRRDWDQIVICGYSSPTAMLAIEWLRIHRKKFWMEVDGGLIRQDSPLKYRFKKHLVSSASGWLSTGAVTSRCLMHYGAREADIRIYPFTSLSQADLRQQAPEPEEKLALRRELGMEEEKILLAIGQFIPRKGFDVLMKAAAGLPENVGVYFVGGLPTEEYLQMQKTLPRVHFVGFQKKEELRRYYEAADVFVLPTREDIWGLVVNEAMACGLPVITTEGCVAGMELVRNGENGWIVPVGDEKALAEKIMLTLQGDTRAMGRAALETVRPYTIENMAAVHVEIFG